MIKYLIVQFYRSVSRWICLSIYQDFESIKIVKEDVESMEKLRSHNGI